MAGLRRNAYKDNRLGKAPLVSLVHPGSLNPYHPYHAYHPCCPYNAGAPTPPLVAVSRCAEPCHPYLSGSMENVPAQCNFPVPQQCSLNIFLRSLICPPRPCVFRNLQKGRFRHFWVRGEGVPPSPKKKLFKAQSGPVRNFGPF